MHHTSSYFHWYRVLVFAFFLLCASIGCGGGSSTSVGGATTGFEQQPPQNVTITVRLVPNEDPSTSNQEIPAEPDPDEDREFSRVEAALMQNGTVVTLSEVSVLPGAGQTQLSLLAVPPGAYELVVRGYNLDGVLIASSVANLDVGLGAASSITLVLRPGVIVETGPIARPITYTTSPGATLVVGPESGVLSNDTSQGGTASLITGPTQGTLALEADGSFTYTSNPNAADSDSFVYQLSDPNGTAQATATINFTPAGTENLAYIYVSNPTPNGGGGTVTSVAVALDGTLSVVVNEPNVGRPLGIATTPDKRFLYTVNVLGLTLVSYSVDQVTGLISRIGEELDVLVSPQTMAVDPTQRFAYVCHAFGTYTSYLVGANGALSDNPNSPPITTAGFGQSGVPVFNASGNRLYAVNSNLDSITVLAVDETTGQLSFLDPDAPATPTDPGDRPWASVLSRDGNFLYVANYGSDSISSYAFGTNGELVQVSKIAIDDLEPLTLSLHPTLPVLYAAGDGPVNVGGNVYSFSTQTDGSLTEFGTPVPVAQNPKTALVDHTGSFAYVVARTDQIDAYRIGTDGALTVLDSYNFFELSFPSGAVIVPAQ